MVEASPHRNEHLYELSQYSDIRAKVLEFYPSGRIPTVESLEQKIQELRENLSAMDGEYRREDKKARPLTENIDTRYSVLLWNQGYRSKSLHQSVNPTWH